MEARMEAQGANFLIFLWIVGAPALLLLFAEWRERRRRQQAAQLRAREPR
jgi:hypothetical protein